MKEIKLIKAYISLSLILTLLIVKTHHFPSSNHPTTYKKSFYIWKHKLTNECCMKKLFNAWIFIQGLWTGIITLVLTLLNNLCPSQKHNEIQSFLSFSCIGSHKVYVWISCMRIWYFESLLIWLIIEFIITSKYLVLSIWKVLPHFYASEMIRNLIKIVASVVVFAFLKKCHSSLSLQVSVENKR